MTRGLHGHVNLFLACIPKSAVFLFPCVNSPWLFFVAASIALLLPKRLFKLFDFDLLGPMPPLLSDGLADCMIAPRVMYTIPVYSFALK
jgi:hypothetical protein